MTALAAARARGPTLADAGAGLSRAAVFVSLLLFSGALLAPLLTKGDAPDASAALRALWLPVYAVGAGLALARPFDTARTAAASWLILIPVGLALVSPLWALDGDLALRRALALGGTTLFGLGLATSMSWRGLIVTLAWVFAALAAGSLIAGLVFPGFGVMHDVHAGAWRGLWWEKNTLGSRMAWAAVTFVTAAIIDDKRRRWWLGGAALAVVLVVLSQSATALLALAAGLAAMAGVRLARASGPVQALGGVLALGVGVIGAGVLIFAPETAAAALGKDATLTGRTEIWAALEAPLRERFWFGWGYDVFWSVADGPAATVRALNGWDVTSAHNGWLELRLSLGIVGLVAFAAAFAATLAAAAGRVLKGAEGYWIAAALSLIALVTVTESEMLARNGLIWVMFVAMAAKLARGDRDLQPASP